MGLEEAFEIEMAEERAQSIETVVYVCVCSLCMCLSAKAIQRVLESSMSYAI